MGRILTRTTQSDQIISAIIVPGHLKEVVSQAVRHQEASSHKEEDLVATRGEPPLVAAEEAGTKDSRLRSRNQITTRVFQIFQVTTSGRIPKLTPKKAEADSAAAAGITAGTTSAGWEEEGVAEDSQEEKAEGAKEGAELTSFQTSD